MTEQSPVNIRKLLKYTWRPFFSRYGRLTPIQAQTIPKILAGFNVVASAPTASGKTESVVAPVAERCMQEQWDGLSTIYIVPTRALANDTLVRIEGPLRDMNIITALKHGDKPNLPQQLPNWLITTPESLDSLICRRSALFKSLRTVIIDEIHLLDGTYRGDQLRLLLKRLKILVQGKPISVHLLSATLPNSEEVASRYTDNHELISVSGQRDADISFVSSNQEALNLARRHKWKKLLFFCNRRETVENVAAELKEIWKLYPVVAHHGSLGKAVREEAEKVMKESPVAICVATSTLEIGIDIGDIDLVVLAEPPWSISSLLQRIGRGNRRSGKVQAAAIVNTDAERQMMESMFQTATEGVLEIEPYKANLSVAVQQIFSLLYQHRSNGVPHAELVIFLSGLCNDYQSEKIATHLWQEDWIQLVGGRWYPTENLMNEGEKGRIHSNIPDQSVYRVVDTSSNVEVGKIAGVFDNLFLLAGSAWKVVLIEGSTIQAKRVKGIVASSAFSRQRGHGAFHRLLPSELC
jgi:ATP-dependent Lhr-like helicase